MALELEDITGAVIGAAIEVHRALGPGFLESVYEAALAVELEFRCVPFARQVPVTVRYRGGRRVAPARPVRRRFDRRGVEGRARIHTRTLRGRTLIPTRGRAGPRVATELL